jgi:uncharacterized protein
MRQWVKRVSVGVASLGLAAALFVTGVTLRTKLPGEEITPAGVAQSSALYLKMRDGIEIAVSINLPQDLQEGERVPVLMRTTRYWREPQIGWLLRTLAAIGQVDLNDILAKEQTEYFSRRQFAVLAVDARGSGASGGNRAMEYSPAEVADMGEVAAWAAVQSWSNGRVGTFGTSYEGNTAELAAVPNQRAIRALMPLYDDFDVQDEIQPDGVTFRWLVQNWSSLVAALDRDDLCAVEQVKRWGCWRYRQMTPGVRPVDADLNAKHLAQLVSERRNLNVAEAVAKIEFRDDKVSTNEGAFSMQGISPYGLRTQIERSKSPMMVWCGWLDEKTCEGTLIRYKTFSNPQVVIIAPLSHGGHFDVDPFGSNHTVPAPTRDEQFRMEADFFDSQLRDDNPRIVESSIQYYTMGEGKWHTTKTWPPAGVSPERLYFGDHHALSPSAPSEISAADAYTVDFTASTGSRTRWQTGVTEGDVIYPDRAREDQKLLVYTSAPLEADVEITGSPVLTLEISSTADDGALHAYLEDVSAEGRVTYLDEGILRLIDRREVVPESLPYKPLGPAHSFLRKDAEPLIPGHAARIRLALYPTSILLRRGHRIRVALAGADAELFQRYPANGTPTWTIHREAQKASFIDLPLRRNRETSP